MGIINKVIFEEGLMEDFLFADDIVPESPSTQMPWKVLIVDDDPGIHDVTILALKNLRVQNRPVSFTSVYSAKEAQELIEHDQSFAVALIDVVMESTHAGLELTQHIRKELLNPYLRIIIRTGQSGKAPEKFVIDNYDINDYKDKTELNADKLYSSVKIAIDSYSEIMDFNHENDKLYKQVVHNPLTNLYNRHKLQTDLLHMSEITVILFNLDRFSHINDLYGYKQGNYIIEEVGRTLQLLEDENNKIYHIGIDEFIILREHSSAQETDALIAKIINKFQNTSLVHEEIDINITFTIGIVENETEFLCNKADLAVKEARLISSNRVQRYHDNMKIQQDIFNNLLWFKEIKNALKQDRIVPYFQAIYNNRNSKIEKYECLVRLIKGDEVISPISFLDVAEETGLLTQITKVMLEKSVLFFTNNDFSFSINITKHDLQDEHFADYVASVLEKNSISAERLTLEILENSSLGTIPNSKHNITRLHDLGCKISLDDFGAQCQNFANMLDLQLDTIKIDGYFIKNLKEEIPRNMVDSIVYFANKMGIELVAEFVCDKDVFEIVKELDIKYSQGYYISEPLPYLVTKEDPLS